MNGIQAVIQEPVLQVIFLYEAVQSQYLVGSLHETVIFGLNGFLGLVGGDCGFYTIEHYVEDCSVRNKINGIHV